jgi:hypothetical protein
MLAMSRHLRQPRTSGPFLDSIVTVFGGRVPKARAAQTSRRLEGQSHEAGRLGNPMSVADIARSIDKLDEAIRHIHGDAGGDSPCTSTRLAELWDEVNSIWHISDDKTDSVCELLRLALTNLQFEIGEKRRTGCNDALNLTAAAAQVMKEEVNAMEEQQNLRANRKTLMGSSGGGAGGKGGAGSGYPGNVGGSSMSGAAPLGAKRNKPEDGAPGGEHAKRHRGGGGAERPVANSGHGRPPPPPLIHLKVSKDPDTPSAIGTLETAMQQRFKHLNSAIMPCPWAALFGCKQSDKCARCQAQLRRDTPIMVPPEMIAKVRNSCSEELQRLMIH